MTTTTECTRCGGGTGQAKACDCAVRAASDRELLELAAKAAGVALRDLDDRYDGWEETPVRIHKGWNPLTDDGDALRLAVKMGLAIVTPRGQTTVYINSNGDREHPSERHGDYPYAATRRAIVRAAAAIGKAMP